MFGRVADVLFAIQQQMPRVLPKKIGTRVRNNVAAALTAVMNSTAVSRADEQELMTQSSRAKRFITDCDDEDGLADMRNKTRKAPRVRRVSSQTPRTKTATSMKRFVC